MVGKLFSMLSVNVVQKNNGILQKGTIGVCLGGPVRGNIKVKYSHFYTQGLVSPVLANRPGWLDGIESFVGGGLYHCLLH